MRLHSTTFSFCSAFINCLPYFVLSNITAIYDSIKTLSWNSLISTAFKILNFEKNGFNRFRLIFKCSLFTQLISCPRKLFCSFILFFLRNFLNLPFVNILNILPQNYFNFFCKNSKSDNNRRIFPLLKCWFSPLFFYFMKRIPWFIFFPQKALILAIKMPNKFLMAPLINIA